MASTDTPPIVNEVVKSILDKEPTSLMKEYQLTSPLAEQLTWLMKEWKVPVTGSETIFWVCANQLETVSESADTIVYVHCNTPCLMDGALKRGREVVDVAGWRTLEALQQGSLNSICMLGILAISLGINDYVEGCGCPLACRTHASVARSALHP